MQTPRKEFRVFDLATLWHEFTGFGFVFAVWMVRKDALEEVSSIDFAAARDEGLAKLTDIERTYVEQIGLSEKEIRDYLTENIVFKVDEEMRKGLTLYFELAAKHQLISQAK